MHLNQHISRKLSYVANSQLPLPLFNSKLKALVQQGHYIEALQLYSRNPSLQKTKFTFPSILRACASLSYFLHGKALHSIVIASGLYNDPFIITSLINMYVKCGSLHDAVQVFDELPETDVSVHDVTIWNSLIDGYFRFGRSRDGLVQFRRMQSLGVRPDAYSLCILLGVRNGDFCFIEGKQIHGHVVRNMFTGDPFLDGALMDMYFHFRRPMDAWRYFFKDVKDKTNVVAWNVMIAGFSENRMWENGLKLYSLAKSENVIFVSTSFTSTLSACCQDEFLRFGEQVHCDAIKMGFESDPYVRTSLLTMYAKCKFVADAEKVFGQFAGKDTELWNAMISAYVGNGCAYDGLKIYKQMKLCEILPDSFTMLNVLSASCMIGFYDFGLLVHTELVKRPIQTNVAVQSALLTMYSKSGNSDDAHTIFSEMQEKDVVAWGSMISGFCHNRKYKEAFDFFRAMQANGVEPDSDIMTSFINASTRIEDINLGSAIQGFVIKIGLESDVFVGSSLVDMYSKFGFPVMAGDVFADMPIKNLVAWNSIISCYCQNGLPDLSINLFPQMMQHGFYPDPVSITTVLVAVSSIAALLKGKSVHGYLIRFGVPSDLQMENALIDMYVKCGFLKYAYYIFHNMSQKNLVTWNTMISGYGSHGDCLKAIGLFDDMRSSGVTPDDITFLSLLSSCNHSGSIDEGLNLVELMRIEFGIEPRMEHYVNIVDLLGRAGRLDDAHTFVKNMPIEPDRSVWLSLLCSSRVHRNVELGELAAHKLLEFEPCNSSNYVQLLNLYHEAGMWDKAASLRVSMKEKGLKKYPGRSWIEVRNRVNDFYSGDCSSATTVEIYQMLSSLTKNMTKKGGSYEIVEAHCE